MCLGSRRRRRLSECTPERAPLGPGIAIRGHTAACAFLAGVYKTKSAAALAYGVVRQNLAHWLKLHGEGGEQPWSKQQCKEDLDCLVEFKNPRLPKKSKKNKPELKLALRDQFGAEITGVAAVGAGPPATSEGNDDTAVAAQSVADPDSDDEENTGPIAMDLDD